MVGEGFVGRGRCGNPANRKGHLRCFPLVSPTHRGFWQYQSNHKVQGNQKLCKHPALGRARHRSYPQITPA